MARPERNNVDYFPLYIDNGRKMYIIEMKYGNDGYATWIKILSELAKANYHYLNLKEKSQKMYLSAVCKVDENILINIINDLVELGEFNSVLWKNEILFSEKFIESIKDAYKHRNNEPVNLQRLVTLLHDLGITKTVLKVDKSYKEDSKKREKPKYKKEEKNIIPPTIEMIFEYAKTRNSNVDVNKFFNFYESKGWLVGKAKMKDWQASFRTWEQKQQKYKYGRVL